MTPGILGPCAWVLVQSISIESIEPPAPAAPQQGAVEVKDLRVGDDENKRYFLIGPNDLTKSPADGFKLLLVLPGGDGGADFQPFVTNIYKNALPEGYVVAQLVAPKWSEEQANKVVWPTKQSDIAEVKVTTEGFIDAVINDVKSKCKIDSRFVFTLSWSSGGPAAYAASLDAKTQVTGSFVAMSVFNPKHLPDLKNAKGKSYYILHSPQDFIKMRFPEAARDQLAENGAATKLVTYEGGHGWRGDVFGMIRAGIEWLETETSK